MSNKRQNDNNNNNNKRRSNRDNEREIEYEDNNQNNNNEENELVFEDPFGDEFEEEDIIEEDLDEDDDEDDNDNEQLNHDESKISGNEPQTRVWRPGVDTLEEGETLDYDPSAYVTYHSLRTEWPCLSFDIIRDNLGEGRIRFPLSMIIVAGSQADRAEKNKITVLKISDVQKTQTTESDDENDDEDDDDNEDDDPTLEHVNISHMGGINRIRAMPQESGIVATMSDSGKAHIYDLTRLTRSMMINGPRAAPPNKAAYTFKGHREEGYAIDWSPVTSGQLATGDCSGSIYIWNNVGNGSGGTLATSFKVSKAYLGHNGSVEDLQWSPTESTVFSSASVDQTVRIWDTRGKNGPQITINAHDMDVNVISWNKNVNYLLSSGCDDGSFKVWDLRAIREAQPLAHFCHHRQPITSIEWAPHDESMLTISSADNTITTWDLSVESDDVPDLDPTTQQQTQEYPPQLLFIHQGQTNIKEIHHHPQIPGLILSSAEDSFNLYKPAITVSSSS